MAKAAKPRTIKSQVLNVNFGGEPAKVPPRLQINLSRDYQAKLEILADRDHRTRKSFMEAVLMKLCDKETFTQEEINVALEKMDKRQD